MCKEEQSLQAFALGLVIFIRSPSPGGLWVEVSPSCFHLSPSTTFSRECIHIKNGLDSEKKKKNSSPNLFISITGNQMFLPTFKSVNRKYSKSQKKINKKIWQSVSQDSYAKDFPFPLKRFENILYIFFKYIYIFSKQLKGWRAQLPFPNGFLLWRSLDRVWRTLKSEQIYLCVPAWKEG